MLALIAAGAACAAESVRAPVAREVMLHTRGVFGGPEPLETNFLLRVEATALLVATHRRHLTVLDTLGRVVARFGREGSGPGEFLQAMPAGTVADSIWINDRLAGRYTVYHPTSATYRTATLPVLGGRARGIPLDWFPGIAGLLGDGRVLATGLLTVGDDRRTSAVLAVVGAEGSLDVPLLAQPLRTACVVPNGGRPFTLLRCQRPLSIVAPDGRSATGLEEGDGAAQGMMLRLTRVTSVGDTVMRATILLPARALTRRLLDSLVEASGRILGRPVTSAGFNPPPRLAAVQYGHQGNDGTLWLGAPRTAQGQSWYVVRPDGALVGEVVLDAELRLGDVTQDGAWAVRDLENGDAELVRIVLPPSD